MTVFTGLSESGKSSLAFDTIFANRVRAVVSQIPKGKTMTYKEVAERAGSPRAFRAVGNILNKNFDPNIPCHRVVRSDGTTGGYNRGAKRKREILQEEGVLDD
ncbi:MAG: methylated-DNA--[protein]-cysteine S-methyltransferase [Candidatus Moraniibacteriota bacterium]|nr:MAG: methylated-DNA--[protein]-cysteine S-methyltransferase [Candidatus Moranbacteria bacterium]